MKFSTVTRNSILVGIIFLLGLSGCGSSGAVASSEDDFCQGFSMEYTGIEDTVIKLYDTFVKDDMSNRDVRGSELPLEVGVSVAESRRNWTIEELDSIIVAAGMFWEEWWGGRKQVFI